jgi:hypothetical protein
LQSGRFSNPPTTPQPACPFRRAESAQHLAKRQIHRPSDTPSHADVPIQRTRERQRYALRLGNRVRRILELLSEALIGLLGVVLGAVIAGLIARATQGRGLRAELDRYWAARLHDAASDLVASYTSHDRRWIKRAKPAGRQHQPTMNWPMSSDAMHRHGCSLCPMADAYKRRLITYDAHLTRFAPPT